MNIKIPFFFFISLFLVTSCADEELAPVIDYSNLQFGAYVRLLDRSTDLFDLQNAGSASMAYTVEFVDVEKGATVTNYDIYVSFDDNSPSNGDGSKSEQLYKSFGTADFAVNGNGFVGLDVTIPLSDLLGLLNLSEADLFARDEFEFRSEIKTTEGRTHTADNSSAAVNGSAFAGFFDFKNEVICGVDDSKFVGEYTLSYSETPTGGLGAAFGDTPGKITLETVSGSTTQRQFTIVYLPGDRDLEITVVFDLLCEITEAETILTGLSCVSGAEATIDQGDTPGVFNIADDGEITLNLVEFAKDGGCSQDAAPLLLKLTK